MKSYKFFALISGRHGLMAIISVLSGLIIATLEYACIIGLFDDWMTCFVVCEYTGFLGGCLAAIEILLNGTEKYEETTVSRMLEDKSGRKRS